MMQEPTYGKAPVHLSIKTYNLNTPETLLHYEPQNLSGRSTSSNACYTMTQTQRMRMQ